MIQGFAEIVRGDSGHLVFCEGLGPLRPHITWQELAIGELVSSERLPAPREVKPPALRRMRGSVFSRV